MNKLTNNSNNNLKDDCVHPHLENEAFHLCGYTIFNTVTKKRERYFFYHRKI